MVKNITEGMRTVVLSVRGSNGELDAGVVIIPECEIDICGKKIVVFADFGSPFTMIGNKLWDEEFASESVELLPPDINPVSYGGTHIDVLRYVVRKIGF
ncbi:hypothetical protein NDU88_000317 [Pleurodeles waltl]|uniref:Uncharacterized protein n=1 Tax=Pleurodeles waltl TaxID=8319 RepID=A0AAV7VY17_PLEWA|nr:hypothetical protein NDU88_000317 [Pleurodeles waltl]